MARTNLKALSVYLNEQQSKGLERAAALENRSVSNFLLTLGIQRAEELGITVYGPVAGERDKKPSRHIEAPAKRRASAGR
jgi:hypothetical protein